MYNKCMEFCNRVTIIDGVSSIVLGNDSLWVHRTKQTIVSHGCLCGGSLLIDSDS